MDPAAALDALQVVAWTSEAPALVCGVLGPLENMAERSCGLTGGIRCGPTVRRSILGLRLGRAALQEAAHALLAYVAGAKLRYVTIREAGDGRPGGHLEVDHPLANKEDFRGIMERTLASPATLTGAGYPSPQSRGFMPDRSKVGRLGFGPAPRPPADPARL